MRRMALSHQKTVTKTVSFPPLLKGDYIVNANNLSFHFYEINDLHVRDVIHNIKAPKGFGNENIFIVTF